MIELLSRLLQHHQLPLFAENAKPEFDFDFEVKQLLNIYTLHFVLYNFVWGGLKSAINKAMKSDYEDGKLPRLDMLRESYKRVANDVEIVQRAMIQRMREPDYDGSRIMGSQAKALLVADKLALKAINPFRHLLPNNPYVNPITYFSKDTAFHHVPYHDNSVLIGIKYDHIPLAINKRWYGDDDPTKDLIFPSFELMAISHEVGHYFYRYASLEHVQEILGQRLEHHQAYGREDMLAVVEQFLAFPAEMLEGPITIPQISQYFDGMPFQLWCEEIFADVYGSIIAGPLLSLSLQALLANSDDDAVCANDGEHPPAILRPFILSEILHILNELDPEKFPYTIVPQRLNENWAMILERYGHTFIDGNPTDGSCVIKMHHTHSYHFATAPYLESIVQVNVPQILDAIRPMIRLYAEIMLAYGSMSNISARATPWSQDDHDQLQDYDQKMAELTGFDFAFKPVPYHTFTDRRQTNERGLEKFLMGWADKGPVTIGPHKVQASFNTNTKTLTLNPDDAKTLQNANRATLQSLSQQWNVDENDLRNAQQSLRNS